MEIKPFQGLLPEKSIVEKVVSHPYDVVTKVEARKIIEENPLSFLRITRSDAEFGDEVTECDESVYKRAREILIDFIDEKILYFDKTPSFYLISQKKGDRIQNGIYCLVRCKDYENNLIKRHELTRKDKENDRTKHILIVKADTGPVFLFFRSSDKFKKMVREFQTRLPDYNFRDSYGVEFKLWKIFDRKDIFKLQGYFRDVKSFYIADGHHRAASAVNVWNKLGRPKNSPYSYFMGVVFPSDELDILSYNRVVYDLKMSENEFLDKVSENFNIMETYTLTPEKKGEIGMCLGNKKYMLHFKGEIKDILDGLDVSILQNYLLKNVLEIDDARTSMNIGFIGGEVSENLIIDMIREGKAKVGFFLYPVDINDLMKIADMGIIMPPKSTWFEPKLKDGLVTYFID